ncbi:histone H3.Y-like [Melanerpes formicivorus]|uniref:histone H3.Y-like n=1 Tax=Melanerpes formicivorus TaxID=211600 RepID=UPI00358EBC57
MAAGELRSEAAWRENASPPPPKPSKKRPPPPSGPPALRRKLLRPRKKRSEALVPAAAIRGLLRGLPAGLAVNGEAVAVNGEAVAVNGEAVAVNGEAVAVNGEAVAVNGEAVAVNGEAVAALQAGCQAQLLALFEAWGLCALHAQRAAVRAADLNLVRCLQRRRG